MAASTSSTTSALLKSDALRQRPGSADPTPTDVKTPQPQRPKPLTQVSSTASIPDLAPIMEEAGRVDAAIARDPNRPEPRLKEFDEKEVLDVLKRMHAEYAPNTDFHAWFKNFVTLHPALKSEKFKNKEIADKDVIALIKDAFTKTDPWGFRRWETWFSGILAGLAAFCSAYPAFRFVETVVDSPFAQENVNAYLRIVYKNFASIAAFAQGLFFSYHSGFTRLNFLMRYLTNVTKEEFQKDLRENAIPLTTTIASAMVSFLQNWNLYKDLSLEYRWALSLGRFMSALNLNGIFMTNMYKKAGGYRNTPELTIVVSAKDKLNKLAEDPAKHDEFIMKLSASNLFAHFNQLKPSDDAKEASNSLHNIFDALLHILDYKPNQSREPQQSNAKYCNTDKAKSITSYGLAIITAAASYVKSGLSIEGALAVPANYSILISILGYALSASSVTVNTAIIASSLNTFLTAIANTKITGPTHAFKIFIEGLCLLAKGTADVGMVIIDPLVNEAAVTAMMSLLTALTSMAVGHLSIDNFFNQLKNGYHSSCKATLEKAKTAIKEGKTLHQHYESLNASDKLSLVNLLTDYNKWGFESLADSLNMILPGVANELFSTRLKEIFKDFAPKIHSNAPSDAKLDLVVQQPAPPPPTPSVDPSKAVGGQSLPPSFSFASVRAAPSPTGAATGPSPFSPTGPTLVATMAAENATRKDDAIDAPLLQPTNSASM